MKSLEGLLDHEQRLPSVFLKAIDNDDIRTVRTMIKLGQNVSETNGNHDNGLHIALQRRRVNPDMVELLLESGINPEVKNRQHKSAADIAVDMGNTPVVRRISRYIKSQSTINKTIKLASEKKHFGTKEVLKGKIYRVRNN
jgi:ankyrin repeat protein